MDEADTFAALVSALSAVPPLRSFPTILGRPAACVVCRDRWPKPHLDNDDRQTPEVAIRESGFG